MSRITLSSPAKLNLFLKVQNKRPDGYHNIKTIFQRIDLSDEISFRATKGGSIRIICDHPHVPVGPKNFVYQAAELLKREFNVDQGVEIRIKKRIPVAAGLAGGSSNAATALLGLNHAWKLNLKRPKLVSYARKIGSDVAFFLHDVSWGLGTERGDHIRSLNIKQKLWHILVVPRIKMYSWKVYGGLKLQLTKTGDNANILIRNLKEGNILAVGQLLSNDLEKEIIRLSPSLKKLKERLKSLDTKGVMISGSGPSVFGVTMTKKEAEAARSVLSKRFAQVFVVRTL